MTHRLQLALLASVLLVLACTSSAPPSNQPAAAAPGAAGQPQPGSPPQPVPPALTSSPLPVSLPSPSPSPSPSPPPLREATLRLGLEAPTAAQWQLFIADRKGFYRKYALTVQVRDRQLAGGLVDGLGSSAYDLVSVPAEAAVGAGERGSGVRIVAGQLNRAAYALIAARDVNGLADLRGKSLAVADLKAGPTALLKRLLRSFGLSESDYKLVPLGSFATQAAALMNGTVGAALIDPPAAFQLIRQRYRNLAISSDVVPDYQAEVVTVGSSWAARNEDVLVRFLKALVEADAWLYDPRNKQEAAAILADATKTSPADGLRTYELLIEKNQALAKAGEVNLTGLRTVIDYLAELDSLKRPLPSPEKYVDASFLDKAKR